MRRCLLKAKLGSETCCIETPIPHQYTPRPTSGAALYLSARLRGHPWPGLVEVLVSTRELAQEGPLLLGASIPGRDTKKWPQYKGLHNFQSHFEDM